jgi:hypothetical protein
MASYGIFYFIAEMPNSARNQVLTTRDFNHGSRRAGTDLEGEQGKGFKQMTRIDFFSPEAAKMPNCPRNQVLTIRERSKAGNPGDFGVFPTGLPSRVTTGHRAALRLSKKSLLARGCFVPIFIFP